MGSELSMDYIYYRIKKVFVAHYYKEVQVELDILPTTYHKIST